MRLLFIAIFCQFLCSESIAQSCPATITLNSQQEVDDFPSDYPGCDGNGITNILSINDFNDPIYNLDSLYQLTVINGGFYVQNCDSLNNIDGLSNLDSIQGNVRITGNDKLSDLNGFVEIDHLGGDFVLINNAELQSISALSNVDQIQGSLQVDNHPQLSSLDGLNNITQVTGNLYIIDNPLLTDLTGLSSMEKVLGGLAIAENDLITSMNGLENLDSIGGNLFSGLIVAENMVLQNLNGLENIVYSEGILTILDNPMLIDISGLSNTSNIQQLDITGNLNLSDCAVQSVCDALDNGATSTIVNNSPGCNSITEVETACTALPLEWTSPLIARKLNHTVELTWSASNQINNDYFQIEKSTDGSTFEFKSIISGESSLREEIEYTFTDKEPLAGLNYYRIKQVDFSGEFTYSNLAAINWTNNDSKTRVFPNPAQGIVYIEKYNSTELKIYNSIGKLCISETLDAKIESINIRSLPKGIYYLDFVGDEVQKVIIQ